MITEHNNDDEPEQGEFRRVEMTPDDELIVTAEELPTAVWVPSGATIRIEMVDAGAVLDMSEVVQHHDIVSLDRTLFDVKLRQRVVSRNLRRAQRKLRGLQDRPDRP